MLALYPHAERAAPGLIGAAPDLTNVGLLEASTQRDGTARALVRQLTRAVLGLHDELASQASLKRGLRSSTARLRSSE